MSTDEQLYRSWSDAANDLGIEVDRLGDGVVVRSFGSRNGMLCSIRETTTEQRC